MGKKAGLFLLAVCLLAGRCWSDDDSAARHRAGADLSAHRYREALADTEPLLRLHPNDASLWTLRGLALEGLGQTEESLAAFDRALRLDPRYVPALEGAAQTTYLHRDRRAAAYLHRLLLVVPQNETANAMAGAVAWQAKNYGEAVGYFSRAQEAVDHSPTALSEYADCLLKNGEADKADALLTRGVQLHPESTQLRYNLAVLDLQNHNPAAAISLLEPIAAARDAGLLNLLASAYVQASRPDDAFRTLEDAIRIRPDQQSNYLDLAILCLDHNDEKRSIQAAAAGITVLPKAASLYLIRGVAYAQLGDYKEAEDDFVSAAAIEPDQPHSTIAMSMLYSDRQQVDREKELLENQLKKTPGDAVTNYLYADLLMRLGAAPGQPAFRQAKEHVSVSLESRPDSAEAQVLLGRILQEENDSEAALKHFELALRVDPDNQAALNRELLVLRKLHRYDDAQKVITHLKQVLSRNLHQGSGTRQVRADAPAP